MKTNKFTHMSGHKKTIQKKLKDAKKENIKKNIMSSTYSFSLKWDSSHVNSV